MFAPQACLRRVSWIASLGLALGALGTRDSSFPSHV
jgi:hypothetical protein